jgi:aminocarboxymuconate-semialdehyde decarboxylase
MPEPSNRYDLTAARSHVRTEEQRRDYGLTIDCHSHVLVPAAAEAVRAHLKPDPHAGVYSEDTRILRRRQDEDRTPNLVNLDLRLRDYDSMRLHAQIVSPAPGQCYYNVPDEVGAEAARLVNEGIAACVAARPGRIAAGLGSVPLGAGGDVAAAELSHCMTELNRSGPARSSWARWCSSTPAGSPNHAGSGAATPATSSATRSIPPWRCTT